MDRLCELRLPEDPCQGLLPEDEELVGDASLRTLLTSCFFNLPEFCHQLHCLGRDLGTIRGVELVELPTAMGPTAGQYHTLIAAVGSGHLVVGTLAVDLKQKNGAKNSKLTKT